MTYNIILLSSAQHSDSIFIFIYCEIIITISLVNIHKHMDVSIFLMMRTFKIYSMCNFQICNKVLLTIVTMLYIPYLFMTRSLYLFTSFISCSHHQSLGRIFFNVQDAVFLSYSGLQLIEWGSLTLWWVQALLKFWFKSQDLGHNWMTEIFWRLEVTNRGNLNHGFLFIFVRWHWPIFLKSCSVQDISWRVPTNTTIQTPNIDLKTSFVKTILSKIAIVLFKYLKTLL